MRWRNPRYNCWSITAARVLLVANLLSAAATDPACAQGEGTCDNPIIISYEGNDDPITIQLDTRSSSNNENDACVDSLATGPDLVLSTCGDCIHGLVTWTADFDAVVYYRADETQKCDARCLDHSTTGSLEFTAPWIWVNNNGIFGRPYIIVDGLNGAAGSITLTVTDLWVVDPVYERSWGYIKGRYR